MPIRFDHKPGLVIYLTAGDPSLDATRAIAIAAIDAGADVILVPSRFEPCGLTQLYALRYGTLPLVRRVGGLADTVVDANAASLAEGKATGFAFEEDSPQALMSVALRAIDLLRQQQLWQRMMRQAMAEDFSWEAAARQYVALYRTLRPDLSL